jgi:hypothetical protein
MDQHDLILGFWFVDAWDRVPEGTVPWFSDMWETVKEE